MTKVTCNGLGTGSAPYSKEVPTFDLYGPQMSTQGITISIPLRAYARLVNWASLSRTLDGVLDSEPNPDSLDDLEDLRQALCDCHEAIRRHWGELK